MFMCAEYELQSTIPAHIVHAYTQARLASRCRHLEDNNNRKPAKQMRSKNAVQNSLYHHSLGLQTAMLVVPRQLLGEKHFKRIDY